MPVVTLHQERFSELVGRPLTAEEMAKWLPWIGLDVEEVGRDYVRVEYSPNRVDFSSHVGVARAFKGLMELEVGLPQYEVKEGDIVVNVDESIGEVRPYILGAVVKGLKLDEDVVKELMEMQEDLHWGVGRNRKKASIGVHDLNAVEPPFAYTTADPDAVKFVPLGWAKEASLREILAKHEKGLAFRHLINWALRYPLLIDKRNEVLSMPPIVNGELTRVSPRTKDVFIDVTGPDFNAVTKCLNVFVTALADLGGVVESVVVKYVHQELISPDLRPSTVRLRLDYARRLLGLRITERKAVECLNRCRLGAKAIEGGVLEVSIPAYRIDILHEVDLVEELAIGYGYYRLKPKMPATITVGEQHPTSKLVNFVRQIMIGLGFTEAMNFTLTNEAIHYAKMRGARGKPIRLANPVSSEYSMMREELLPSLLKNLADNVHESYPQRLFEVSDVLRIEPKAETRSERRPHVAGVSAYANASYTEARCIVDSLLNNLGVKRWKIKATRHPSFIPGRVASIYIGRKKVGVLGEVHPEVLNNFGIGNPVAAFEMDLEPLMKFKR